MFNTQNVAPVAMLKTQKVATHMLAPNWVLYFSIYSAGFQWLNQVLPCSRESRGEGGGGDRGRGRGEGRRWDTCKMAGTILSN